MATRRTTRRSDRSATPLAAERELDLEEVRTRLPLNKGDDADTEVAEAETESDTETSDVEDADETAPPPHEDALPPGDLEEFDRAGRVKSVVASQIMAANTNAAMATMSSVNIRNGSRRKWRSGPRSEMSVP